VSDDALATVLGLVAEGRLTAQEAGPIIDRLTAETEDDPTPSARPDEESPAAAGAADRVGRAIRLEVRDEGGQVMNLRIPLSLGRAALSRVPGLSDAITDRIREAIDAGVTGSILDVDEGTGDRVRIVIE
jgi:hypothetical protein